MQLTLTLGNLGVLLCQVIRQLQYGIATPYQALWSEVGQCGSYQKNDRDFQRHDPGWRALRRMKCSLRLGKTQDEHKAHRCKGHDHQPAPADEPASKPDDEGKNNHAHAVYTCVLQRVACRHDPQTKTHRNDRATWALPQLPVANENHHSQKSKRQQTSPLNTGRLNPNRKDHEHQGSQQQAMNPDSKPAQIF